MTDQELDRLLRRALLDAADQEAQTPPETETPLSEGHRRRMREMLRDPLLWFRLRNPYPWRTVARRAAVVLLMLSLSAAMVLAVSPKARADIIRWTMQQDGRRVEFRYHGDGPAQALPQYRIAALPEGYTETERAASYAAGDVKYTNADGERSKPCHEKIGKDFPLLVLGTDDVPFPDGSRICGRNLQSLVQTRYCRNVCLV